MKYIVVIVLAVVVSFASSAQSVFSSVVTNDYVLVVHGGAGGIRKGQLSQEKEQAYINAMKRALEEGARILSDSGTAMDAVELAIRILEDDSLFNAGRGAVFNSEGKNELDASIMDGKTLNAGAVAGVMGVKNPITAARKVMEKSPHVMLAGKGADMFAKEQGCDMVDQKYYYTDRAYKTYEKLKKEESGEGKKSMLLKGTTDEKYGTVGAVALDLHGNLAAGTSTGGMSNKTYGRIGDSPIIGAGTYADNNAAISCTGWGEYYIRLALAKSICDRISLQGINLEDAVKVMIYQELERLGGSGGVISVDKNGNVVMDFNTPGMNRGFIRSNKSPEIMLYGN